MTSNADRIGLRYSPMAFTEYGILMLSSVLNSTRAVQVNIEIMRAFVKLRQMLSSNAVLSRRLDERGSSPTVREGLVNSKLSLTRFESSCRYRSLPTNKSAFANGVRTGSGSDRVTAAIVELRSVPPAVAGGSSRPAGAEPRRTSKSSSSRFAHRYIQYQRQGALETG